MIRRIETPEGIVYWTKDGLIHREDGPAIIYPGGEKAWFLNSVEFDPITWLMELHEMKTK